VTFHGLLKGVSTAQQSLMKHYVAEEV